MSQSSAPYLEVDGELIALDEEGFLIDAGQWRPEVAEALAGRDGLRLGPDHWWLIGFVREYYAAYATPPLMRVVVTELKRRKHDGGSRDLYRLFPDGPVRLACKYGGLPKPDWCI